ncbi:MAG: DPP IV N-terminal domain-containing protein [Flavobacteriales bacterium]|nr:DPP IV N-terminal domain-containing protein [Flavobacteriales bacterium]
MNQRTILFFLLLAFFTPTFSSAQHQLTLSESILKAGSDYAPERLRGLQWVEGTSTYSYVNDSALMIGTLGKSMDRPFVTLRDLNASIPDSTELRRLPAVTWEDGTHFHFMHDGKMFRYEQGAKRIEVTHSLPAEAANEDYDPVQGSIAYTVDDDVFVIRKGGGRSVRITTDGGEGIVNGKSVHRDEYGITKGTFWGPKGNVLAFYRMDESMVTEYMLEDISTKPSTFNVIRYPMAGQTSHHVTIGVYDLRSGKKIILNTGAPADQYLTNIAWEHDGAHLQVVHLDRATENLKVVRYSVETGKPVGTLLTEHDDKYLEPQQPAKFLKTKPTQYIWWSQRDGWPHLYLYDLNKGMVRQLTKGNWVVQNIVGMDPLETFVIVDGSGEIEAGRPTGAMDTHLYRVELRSGKTTRLTKEAGKHSGQLSSDGATLIDTWSSMMVPGRTELIDAKNGSIMKTLINSKDPLAEVTKGTMELLTIPGENGDMLNARLIKPSYFDENTRYPVLIYVYGGTHVQLVRNSFLGGASLWMIEAAERGYLVWTVDGHGSSERGRDFEQIIHRQLGITEVNDQMRGVDWLKALPYVDSTRIAVHGWSFGGHMTTAMLTRYPGVFKVGVAGGPVMDWSLYEVMYGERYMDTPKENPKGEEATTLPLLADKLQEDLLLITGGVDPVVLPEHSFSFLKACVDSGTQVDFFDYPGHEHNVRGKDRVHLMEKVLRYIDARMLNYR